MSQIVLFTQASTDNVICIEKFTKYNTTKIL